MVFPNRSGAVEEPALHAPLSLAIGSCNSTRMTTLTTRDGTVASRFAFGTMQFGGRADSGASHGMYDQCRDAGITHFDTAFVYTDGASETLLGSMIASERDSVLVATKAGYVGGAGGANIRAQFDISRQRLGQDQIDVLYLHRFDPDTDLRETIDAFACLKSSGAIRYVGLSNFAAWQVMKTVAIAAEFDLTIDILQPMYNLVKRQVEVEILPMCTDQGIEVAPYSPLGGGLLTGKYATGGQGRLSEDDRYAARYGLDWMHEAANELTRIASDGGLDPATLAVAWVAAHPSAPVPIVSARSTDQLTPSLAAMTYDMDADLYALLSQLVPAPPPPTDRIEELA